MTESTPLCEHCSAALKAQAKAKKDNRHLKVG